jgi:hypothetical protein
MTMPTTASGVDQRVARPTAAGRIERIAALGGGTPRFAASPPVQRETLSDP